MLENVESIVANSGDCESGATALVMEINPVKRMPKPRKISPKVLLLPRLMNIIRIMPTMAASGASVVGLNNSIRTFPLEFRSIKRMICAVMVVPILAPKTILTDCFRLRIPAAIRPTVSTIVAVELCITAVTSIPVIIPINGFCVSLPSAFFSASPEEFFKPSLMTSMPYRKRARPPSNVMTEKIDIIPPCCIRSSGSKYSTIR